MFSLNESFIHGQPHMESLRLAYGETLLDLARNNSDIVAITADLGDSVGMVDFASKLGDRFIDVGIAEQNMVSLAAGLAHMGKIPFVSSYAAFSPGRNWEQIRTNICLNEQSVKIVSTHAGLNVGADGATHQMLEDIALMKSLPNMVVIAPGDAIETRAAIRAIAYDDRPAYVRLPRVDLPTYSTTDFQFSIGAARILRHDDTPAVTIVATGSMTGQALVAAGKLFLAGTPVDLIHLPTIKPLDVEPIVKSLAHTGRLVVIEEHQIAGGLGESVIAAVVGRGGKFAVEMIGVNDEFGQSGTAGELWRHYGFDVDSIVRRVQSFVAR